MRMLLARMRACTDAEQNAMFVNAFSFCEFSDPILDCVGDFTFALPANVFRPRQMRAFQATGIDAFADSYSRFHGYYTTGDFA